MPDFNFPTDFYDTIQALLKSNAYGRGAVPKRHCVKAKAKGVT
jgi:hypothetical protein